MSKPVIFLAFSNDQDDYLSLINAERKGIEDALFDLDKKELIQLWTEATATSEDFYKNLQRYDNEIVIFHYGGHAGGTHLLMESEDGGNKGFSAETLAQFLGHQKELRLVFLNGCATQPQVELLLENNVKAVIATSVEIEDKMASLFSKTFYQYLAKHDNIQRAFEHAKARVSQDEDEKSQAKEVEVFRSIKLRSGDDKAKMPWGLYINENVDGAEKEVMEWSLPRASSKPQLVNKEPRKSGHSRENINLHLIDALCDELAKYNKDLQYELNKKEDFSINAVIREMIDSFPLPIGEHLRKIFSSSGDSDEPDPMECHSVERMQQLGRCYYFTTKFIAYILLSDLWDKKHEDETLKIGEDLRSGIQQALTATSEQAVTFDYLDLTFQLMNFFEDPGNKVEGFFITEFAGLGEKLQKDEAFIEAAETLQALLSDPITEENIVEKSQAAEGKLGVFLRIFAFLTEYNFLSIKDIELIQNRHQDPLFEHKFIRLNEARTNYAANVKEEGLKFENNTDNKSVVFVKNQESKVEDWLNLSPFIIDENSLIKADSCKLFLFSHRAGEEDYAFQFLNNPKEELKVSGQEEQYPEIKDLFDKFAAEILEVQQGAKKEETSGFSSSIAKKLKAE